MTILNELEATLKTDQTETAKILGIGKSAYSQYKNGGRKTPLYIQYSAEVILMLSSAKLKELKYSRLAP